MVRTQNSDCCSLVSVPGLGTEISHKAIVCHGKKQQQQQKKGDVTGHHCLVPSSREKILKKKKKKHLGGTLIHAIYSINIICQYNSIH